jgi:2-oxoglutarate ferredoxin oxidoreductase subunit beta
MQKQGFTFVEILTPCPTSFGRRNKIGTALDTLKFYHERAVIRNDIDPKDAPVDFSSNIVVGKFVDMERPTFLDNYKLACAKEIAPWLSEKNAPGNRKDIREL